MQTGSIGNDQLNFKLNEGLLIIDFSIGNCIRTTSGKWDVQEGKVLNVIFYPKKEKKSSFYNLSKDGMKKEFNQGHIFYTSEEKGLQYSLQFGKVSGIYIYPAKKYDYLKCDEKEDSK